VTAKSPAFQCYSRDVLVRVSRLSAEAAGAYLRIWMTLWTENPPRADVDTMASLAGVSTKKMRAIMPELLEMFEVREGRLFSADLEEQRDHQEKNRQKKQRAAGLSWDSRRRNGSPMHIVKNGQGQNGAESSNGAETPHASASHVQSPAVAVSTAGKTNPPTTSTASARAPEGGWGMAAEEIIGRDDWWHGEPTDLRRQLLPAVMARRTAKDPSATVWGAIKYVLRQPRAGTEHAAAANGNGKSPEAPPLPPELLEPFQRFSALPKPERERWTERGRRKAPGNLTGEDLERAILVCALREFAAAERAPPSHQAA
jgi:uncharacterized protein YdaU (DUF1376 family)